MTDPGARIGAILRADPLRWHLLGVARSLGPPGCWIGAGFVRNAVWDHLHRRAPSPPAGDVDVIWHDPLRADPAGDRRHEAALCAAEPSIRWSVKNQARMHARNGDIPYASVPDAMRHWPETATAVAARRRGADGCDVAAPFGLDDLLALVLRPTPAFLEAKRAVYEERQRAKRWTARWPLLREACGASVAGLAPPPGPSAGVEAATPDPAMSLEARLRSTTSGH